MAHPVIWPFLASLVLATSAPIATGETDFTPTAFAEAEASGRVIVVETYAYWCLACRLQAPLIASLLQQDAYRNVVVLRIGEDAPHHVWKQFGLKSYGMLVVIKSGQEVARGTATTKSAVEALLQRAL